MCPIEGACITQDEANLFAKRLIIDLSHFMILKLSLLLKLTYTQAGIKLSDHNRYVFQPAFTDFIANRHRDDINILAYSSDDVENYGR
jgi:hypothetical protein